MSTPYPPEPWDLRGQLHASVFLVPFASLQRAGAADVPAGWTPVRLGRRAVVGTAWVVYEPGGVLDYREVMATVLVRRGWRLQPTIVRIWVDSPASRDGGRGLWGIPKGLADFAFADGSYAASDADGAIASGTVRTRFTLPRRWPVGFRVVQTLDGAVKVSPVRSKAALAVSAATMDANPNGPLGFLSGHRPWLSFTLRDFAMTFGG